MLFASSRCPGKWSRWRLCLACLFLMLISAGWAQDRGQPSPPNPPSPPPAVTTPNPAVEKSAPPSEMSDMTSPADTAQDSNAQEPATDQGGMFVFKKEVEEVILHATVFDEQRRPVPGLDQNAFTVFENGMPQPITSFRRQDVPVAIGIVVDNSGSMREKRDEVTRAVLNLIRASNPQDQIFVVNFSQHPYLDQDFTSDVIVPEMNGGSD